MAASKRKVMIAVSVVVSCCIVGVVIWACKSLTGFMVPEPLRNIDQTRAKVLYGTDHEELLKVCREKLARYRTKVLVDEMGNEAVQNGDQPRPGTSLPNGTSETEPTSWISPEGDAPKRKYMRILDLEPTFVSISTRYIYLEFCTGFFSVGVMAFPEGVEGYGDMKLVDGLWYWDAGFQHSPNFADHLKKLRVQEPAD